MRMLLIDLYEFTQFLRILAWIFLPLLLVVSLITVWLHRRKKRKERLAEDLWDRSAQGLADENAPRLAIEGAPAETDTPYKGFLWMKSKYEEYRDDTDKRIEKIKEDLSLAEKKYLELLASKGPAPASSTVSSSDSPLDQRINNYHELELLASRQQTTIDQLNLRVAEQQLTIGEHQRAVEEQQRLVQEQQRLVEEKKGNIKEEQNMSEGKQRIIEELQDQVDEKQAMLEERERSLEEQRRAIEAQQHNIDILTEGNAALSAKLDNNIRLLINIHKELNRTLNAEDPDPYAVAHADVPAFSE